VSTILILDDEPAIRTLIRHTLDPLGHVILEAASAHEAFLRLREADAGLNLLIAEVSLPCGPSGVQVALELLFLRPFLRIILICRFPLNLWDDQGAAECSELPSDSVVILEKPFYPAELRRAVYGLIGLPMVMGIVG